MMLLTYPQRAEILCEQKDERLRYILVNQDEHLARPLHKQKEIKTGKAHSTWGLKG
jgi:hypothetical protein